MVLVMFISRNNDLHAQDNEELFLGAKYTVSLRRNKCLFYKMKGLDELIMGHESSIG